MGGETALLDGVTRIAENKGFRTQMKMKFRELAQADWDQVVAGAVLDRVPPARTASDRPPGVLDAIGLHTDAEAQRRANEQRQRQATLDEQRRAEAEAQRRAEEAEAQKRMRAEARRKAEEAEAQKRLAEAEQRRANEQRQATLLDEQRRAEAEEAKAKKAELAEMAKEARRKANEEAEAQQRQALLEAQREADRTNKEVSDQLLNAAKSGLTDEKRSSLWALVDVAIIWQRTVDMGSMIKARKLRHKHAVEDIKQAYYVTWNGRQNDLSAEQARYDNDIDRITTLTSTLKTLYIDAVSLAKRIQETLTFEEGSMLLRYADPNCTSIICRPPYAPDLPAPCSWRRSTDAEQEWTVSGILTRMAQIEAKQNVRVSEIETSDDFVARIKDAYDQVLVIEASLVKE